MKSNFRCESIGHGPSIGHDESKQGSMVGVAALLPSRRQRRRRPPPLLALARDVLIERRYSRGQMLSARLHIYAAVPGSLISRAQKICQAAQRSDFTAAGIAYSPAHISLAQPMSETEPEYLRRCWIRLSYACVLCVICSLPPPS
jgi:hypothetical protein